MDSTTWTAVAALGQIFAAVASLAAVIVALVAIQQNQKQAKVEWDHAQKLAIEDRQNAH